MVFRVVVFFRFLVQNPLKTPSTNHLKTDTEQIEKMRTKSSQNGAKTGSKINEKSMQKLMSKKIEKHEKSTSSEP